MPGREYRSQLVPKGRVGEAVALVVGGVENQVEYIAAVVAAAPPALIDLFGQQFIELSAQRNQPGPRAPARDIATQPGNQHQHRATGPQQLCCHTGELGASPTIGHAEHHPDHHIEGDRLTRPAGQQAIPPDCSAAISCSVDLAIKST